MAAPRMLTYFDAIEATQDFLNGYGSSASLPIIKRSILDAYQEIITLRDWVSLFRNGRIQLHAAQTTGTVTYDYTGGTYERQVTLSDATWPSWAEDAALRIGDLVCDIESRKSDTVVTLDATMCPAADLTDQSYTLYPRWYRLPSDFVSMGRPMGETDWAIGQYISPEEMLALDRYHDTTGDIDYYTIAAAPDLYNQLALYVHPAATADETFDFVYKRQPRALKYSGKEPACSAGTISVTAGSAEVTGSQTSFSSDMVGSILRIGTSATNPPTGIEGTYPWVEERAIVAVTSATALTMDAAATTSRSGVKATITDPIDIDTSLHTAFLRLCEKNIAHARNLEDKDRIYHAADNAIFQAKCGDARAGHRRVAGTPLVFHHRLADYKDRPTSTEL